MSADQLAEKLVLWIRERVSASGCEGVVLGMSGGRDSSVLAVLCREAFPRGVLGLIMPCYSCDEDKEHAYAVAEKFSIPAEVVVLDGAFDDLLKVMPGDDADPGIQRLAEANLKARLRMLTLYYYANKLNYLVAGSSNRSELAVGYFTKYGDGGVDIMPLGGLVKGQVRELARFLGIPQEIIDKPPSAGLWPGQMDEDELGFSYEELDNYLTTGEASNQLRERLESMIVACEHKHLPPPIASF